MAFYGKYSFQSTNTSGAQMFVTAVRAQGQTYPEVSSPSVTEIETFILYQNGDGSLTIQMGDLSYLSADAAFGWVVANTLIAQASPMQVNDQGNGQVSLQIQPQGQTGWQPVRYTVNDELPFLVFPIEGESSPSDPDALFNFAQATITPSLAAIQASKSAQGFDFQNVDLSQADLSGVNCTGANFTNAILDGTNFSGAILTSAIFLGATFTNTNFSGATLDYAVFSGTNVSGVIWGTAISAQHAHFDGAIGIGCKIGSTDPNQNANFSYADFTGANFSQSDFSYASLDNAILAGATFVGAIFQSADLTFAQLGGVTGIAAADMSFTYVSNTIFKSANLFGVSFASATLYGATNMSDALTIEQADFSNAYLEGINLSNAVLNGARFDNSCLVGVDFSNAYLTPTLSGSIPTSLTGACLQGANFTLSHLDGADLSNATVAFSQGTIKVRYCNPLGGGLFGLSGYEPVNYNPTQGLDLTTMTPATTCPNESTVKANQAQGKTLQQMLTTATPRTQWVPVSCSPPLSAVIETSGFVE